MKTRSKNSMNSSSVDKEGGSGSSQTLSIFITVGTTEFNQLIELVNTDEFLNCVSSCRVDKVTVQIGRGTCEPQYLVDNSGRFDVESSFYRFKSNLHDDMCAADIIISHAGAGSILESTALRKPLICVVNSTLQDNHQTELADAVNAMKSPFVKATDPKGLLQTIEEVYTNIISSSCSRNGGKDIHVTADEGFYQPGIFPVLNENLFPSILNSMFEFQS